MSATLYEIVTEKIIEALEKGVVPWRKPWNTTAQLPCNATNNRPYRGVNVFLLGLMPYADHRWLTFRQAQELGGTVRQGEKSTLVVFWKYPDKKPDVEDEEERRRSAPILRYFNVFNAEQVEGLNLPPLPSVGNLTEAHRIERAEVLVRSMIDPPQIQEVGTKAGYSPSRDLVRIPQIGSFDSIDQYYATLFHELAHSTGHGKRLNRPGVTGQVRFGSERYAREELVAELASAFCCATVALDNSILENSAAYIESWIASLRRDPKAIVVAAGQAQKAADYIKGIQYPLVADIPTLAIA